MLKTLFLPVGLIISLLTGVLFPEAGKLVSGWTIGSASPKMFVVIMIFLVTGYKIRSDDFQLGKKFLAVLLAAAGISLLGGPLIAMGIGRLFDANEGFYLGLVVMGAMPTTLSSAVVITRSADGNAIWALMLTVLLNVIGVFLIPFTIRFCLETGGGISISAWPIFKKILLLVVFPLVAGMLVQKPLKQRSHVVLDYLPSLGVILFVWMAVSCHSERLGGLSGAFLGTLIVATLLIHALLMVAAGLSRYPLRLARPETIAILFAASQKTLPIAMTVLVLMEEQLADGLMGMATATCVTFHFMQIITDSILAATMRGKQPLPCDLK